MTTESPLAVLKELGIEPKAVGREITASCPFHEDNHPSFSMNASTGAWICYSCGASGGLGSLAELLAGDPGTGGGVHELVREARYGASRASRGPRRVKVAPREPEPAPESPARLQARYEAFRAPPTWALDDRMLRAADARRFGLAWDHGWIIPIYSPEGEFWGWQFKRLKAVRNHPKGVKKSLTLFGLNCTELRAVVVVESPLDVVRLARVQIPAVATFGAFVSRAQVSLLIEHCDQIVLALDGDETGIEQTQRLYPRLCRLMPTRRVHYPAGAKDPGELDDDECVRLFGEFRWGAETVSGKSRRTDDRQLVVSARARSGTG
jgi:Toprim-like/CHC2 zinc finger